MVKETIVRITAYCVQNVEVEPELTAGLLQLNHEVPIGAFELVGTDIFYSHSLFGRGLNRKNLLGAIAAVIAVLYHGYYFASTAATPPSS